MPNSNGKKYRLNYKKKEKKEKEKKGEAKDILNRSNLWNHKISKLLNRQENAST